MLSNQIVERFGGIARLYGENALIHFTQSHVCIIGIGGVGSWCVEALARSGVGKITLIDFDDICITNVNRQLHAYDGQVGKQKTAAMAERVKAINPECEVTCIERFYTERSADEILDAGFDFIIDAIDHSKAKAHLVNACKQRKIPLILSGAAGGLKDPTKLQVEDLARVHNDGLLKRVRDELRNHYGFPKGNTKGKNRKFGVEAVFSTEQPVFPQCDGSASTKRPQDAHGKSMQLNCASGYGSITHMTATVGFIMVQRCLEKLAQQANLAQ